MRSSAKSRKYANILLDLAENYQALDPVYRTLTRFYAVYRHEPILKAVLASTRINAENKTHILNTVYPDLHPINQVFLIELGELKDMKLLGAILSAVESGYYQRSDQVKVHAVSTSRLSPDIVERIKAAVKSVTARQADFSTEINADILGGLTLRVGNTILDGSLSSKLSRIRESLIQS